MIVREMLIAALVIAAAIALQWIVRRGTSLGFQRKREPGLSIETLDGRKLGAHHSLFLIRFQSKAMLIVTHNAGCSLIHECEWQMSETACVPPKRG